MSRGERCWRAAAAACSDGLPPCTTSVVCADSAALIGDDETLSSSPLGRTGGIGIGTTLFAAAATTTAAMGAGATAATPTADACPVSNS